MPMMPTDPLPKPVLDALDAPGPGQRLSLMAAGIPWSALAWGPPEARPVLLIHGVTSSAAVWWRIGPGLAATGRRVIAVDLPGHGSTGNWAGRHRFRDTAADVAAFAHAAGLTRDDLQVIGHSWGAMIAAALPAAGLRPRTLVLLDPPALSLAAITEATDIAGVGPIGDRSHAVGTVRAENPGWDDGDVQARADALMDLDVVAARSVVLSNGDWDAGMADLADPAAADLDVWVVRGDPAAGSYLGDEVAARIEDLLGAGHVFTIAGAPHSPQRTHPTETMAALLAALGELELER